MVPSWLQLGMQSLRQERLIQAKTLYEQVLQVIPRHADALQWLGVIQHKLGNSERAIELIHQAIAASPGSAFFYSTLGNVLKDIGKNAEAEASYNQALALNPNLVEAHNNLGILQTMQGKLSESIESFRKALALFPGYAEALNNMGIALNALDKTEAALDAFQRAIKVTPNYAEAHLNMGNALHKKIPDQALPYLRRGVALSPHSHMAFYYLARALHEHGELEEARANYAQCLALKPNPGVRIKSALMLPPIMGTDERVLSVRANFEENLAKLSSENVSFDDPLKELCDTNFFLAYHGLNDKDIQTKVARFYAQACPSLLFVARHCQGPRSPQRKKRIGFLSRYIVSHSVALSFSRIVAALSTTGGFDVTLISTIYAESHTLEEFYPNFQGQYVRIPVELEGARNCVGALELDILVYLDIGMESLSYFLAFARLAPVQCVVGGHPVTTGIPTLDYYLSSEMCEIENAQDHYSENLVRLPVGAFYFERPTVPAVGKTRFELGLPTDGCIYACPMTLFKLHPDFDVAMERILQLDPMGHVVLFSDKKFSAWQVQLERRFESTISADVRDRIVFVPWVSDPQEFMRVIAASDVVLDPFHFGIGTTAIPVCAVGTPFVTRPSEFLRGRVGLFFCKLMDLMDCALDDVETYAIKAVSIATNPSERARLKSKILANNQVLFQNEKGLQDLIDFLENVDVPDTQTSVP
jgi:predicted O-linked N-acetylglucosamine transferase (SPINDLY family)